MTIKPSLDLLRSLTDEHVLRALIEHRQATRSDIAARTGISKPTISESVRRLEAAGLVRDTGERTTGRGRAGSYYALAEDLALALVIRIAPAGVVAEAVDVYGEVRHRSERSVQHTAESAEVAAALLDVVEQVQQARPFALATISAADPVNRHTGDLVHLPDSPFLLGDLSPVELLRPYVGGAIVVDNDVNWAAVAGRANGAAQGLDDFVYLYLGDGLGAAVVCDGEVRRGAEGFAGEIAGVLTIGPQRRAMTFTDVFADLGLRRPGTAAIDSERVRAALNVDPRIIAQLSTAVLGVIRSCQALLDPAVVVLDGPWGRHTALQATIQAGLDSQPRRIEVLTATLHDPALLGAREHAISAVRSQLVASTADNHPD